MLVLLDAVGPPDKSGRSAPGGRYQLRHGLHAGRVDRVGDFFGSALKAGAANLGCDRTGIYRLGRC
jgi:hypothetical protein